VVAIDVNGRRIDVELPAGELAARLRGFTAPPPRYRTGVFAKYAAQVSSASEGAVTSPVPPVSTTAVHEKSQTRSSPQWP
jgi:dihydroxy-acid dehydratase